MTEKSWAQQNAAAIAERMQSLTQAPDGLIDVAPAGDSDIAICKLNSLIHLMWVDPKNPNLQQTESRIDPARPLHLMSPYNQVAMLSMAWQPQPKNIYVLGFGGGRIPMVLHHCLPEARIECAEINPVMVDMATKYFGVKLDDRLSVTVQDGRQYLADQPQDKRYDMLHIDGFLTNGFSVYPLVTQEFYQLCHSLLSEQGIMMVNVLNYDTFHAQKIKTIASVFKNSYMLSTINGNSVIIASDTDVMNTNTVVEKAKAIKEKYEFAFPLAEHASKLIHQDQFAEKIKGYAEAKILSDDSPPSAYSDDKPTMRLMEKAEQKQQS